MECVGACVHAYVCAPPITVPAALAEPSDGSTYAFACDTRHARERPTRQSSRLHGLVNCEQPDLSFMCFKLIRISLSDVNMYVYIILYCIFQFSSGNFQGV